MLESYQSILLQEMQMIMEWKDIDRVYKVYWSLGFILSNANLYLPRKQVLTNFIAISNLRLSGKPSESNHK